MTRILDASLEQQRRDRTSVKWQVFGPDVIPVWVAEMDARPCEPVVEAVHAAMLRGDTGYTWPAPYAAALSGFAARRWGWEPDPDTMVVGVDVMVSVQEVLRSLTDPEGAIVVSPPCYDSFFGFVDALERRRVDAPLTRGGRLDLETLRTAFVAATARGGRAAYLLCNPQNPTGAAHTREELAALAALAAEHGVRVVADEIHAPLVHAGARFTPYLAADETGLGFAVHSPSKAWNLAALKCALTVPGERAVDDLRRVHEVHTHGASHLAAIAHTVAYEQGEAWLDQLLSELAENIDRVDAAVRDRLPGVRWTRPEATYLAWLDMRGTGLGDDPAAELVTRGRVALSNGPRFGADAGRGFARLNMATSPQILDEALARIATVLQPESPLR